MEGSGHGGTTIRIECGYTGVLQIGTLFRLHSKDYIRTGIPFTILGFRLVYLSPKVRRQAFRTSKPSASQVRSTPTSREPAGPRECLVTSACRRMVYSVSGVSLKKLLREEEGRPDHSGSGISNTPRRGERYILVPSLSMAAPPNQCDSCAFKDEMPFTRTYPAPS